MAKGKHYQIKTIKMTKTKISYSELAEKVGDMILMNNATNHDIDDGWYYGLITQPLLEAKLEADSKENERPEDEPYTVLDVASECYQVYAITQRGAEYLFNHTTEVIHYSENLGCWFWHIGHFGTSWDGVHTDIYTGDDIDDNAVYGHEELMKYAHG